MVFVTESLSEPLVEESIDLTQLNITTFYHHFKASSALNTLVALSLLFESFAHTISDI